MKLASLRYWLVSLLSLLLVSCGGGSDGTLTLTGASTYTLAMTLSANNVSAAASANINLELRNPQGALHDGLVSLRTTAGRLAATSVQTAGGMATVPLFAGSGGRASGTVTAFFVDPSGNTAAASRDFTTEGDEVDAGTPGNVEPWIEVSVRDSNGVVSDAANPISNTAPGVLRAVVRSATGAGLSNVVVTFNSGSLASVSQATALTDATGLAQVAIAATGAGAGTASASAQVGDFALSGSAVYAAAMGGGGGGGGTGTTLALEVRNSSGVVADSANPLTNLAPGTVRATLTQNGSPLANTLVNFALSGDVATLGQASALTDTAGQASVPVTATKTGAGSASASVAGGPTQTAVFATSTGGGVTDRPVITLSVLDSSNRPINASNPISVVSGGKLRARITLNGDPVSGQVVTFALETGTGAALPQTVALTATNGYAEVPITAAATGAGTVGASATVNSVLVSVSQPYATSVAETRPLTLELGSYDGSGNFRLGVLTSDVTGELTPGSSATITAHIREADTGVPYTGGSLNVEFSSNCTASEKATIDATAPTTVTYDGNGDPVRTSANAIYVPSGCIGTDTVTATLRTQTQNLAATTNVRIASEPARQIRFDSAVPESGRIALKGTGSADRPESADVYFLVLSNLGNPVANTRVCFELSTQAGGVLIAPTSASTDTAGKVKTTVSAGTIPTPVRISAYVDNDDNCSNAKPQSGLIQTVSELLSISTGLPDQKSFSLSVSNFNPLAYEFDGVDVNVTVYAADHFNNPVPPGTTINFWTESGAITPSCVTGESGTCMVGWRSQNPRDTVDTRDRSETGLAFRDRKGRSTILAYVLGEESFVDVNGNGVWDESEPATALGEAIKDANLNGERENLPGFVEEFVDQNHSGAYDTANAIYDGVLCSDATRNNGTCSGNASVHVRAYNQIVLSSQYSRLYPIHPSADISALDFDTDGNMVGVSNPGDSAYEYVTRTGDQFETISKVWGNLRNHFAVLATDANGNTLAAGTRITASLDPLLGTVVGASSYTIGQISGDSDWFAAFFAFKPSTSDERIFNGFVTIEVQHPAPEGSTGRKEAYYVELDWNAPP